jgi:MinD-like ATPase involved in chromosome partitioning or flagellar assembly
MDELLVKSYAAGIPVVREHPQAPSARIFMRLAGKIAAANGL